MVRTDYKKAYEMVPQFWIIKCLIQVQVSEDVIKFIERSVAYLRAVLTMSEYMLVLFRRGVFRMIPLPGILRKARTGYMLDGVKINHLLCMDDLNFFWEI